MKKACSDFQQFSFLGGKAFFDFLDILVGEFLDFFFGAGKLVFGDFTGFLKFLDFIDGMAAIGADADAPFLGHLAHSLDEVLAPFLGKRGNGKADKLAVHLRHDAELRFLERLADRFDRGGVPGLDLDKTGIGRGDGGEFLETHVRTIGFHHEVGDEIG